MSKPYFMLDAVKAAEPALRDKRFVILALERAPDGSEQVAVGLHGIQRDELLEFLQFTVQSLTLSKQGNVEAILSLVAGMLKPEQDVVIGILEGNRLKCAASDPYSLDAPTILRAAADEIEKRGKTYENN
jgi:hypothetical protein